MLTAIGLMIAAYIVVRLLAICAQPTSAFMQGTKGFVVFFCVIAMLVAIGAGVSLLSTPTPIPAAP